MTQITRRPFLMGGATLFLGSAIARGQSINDFLGDWFGALDVGSRRLRLKLTISAGPTATLYSLDQGAAAIPSAETRVTGARIFVSWPSIQARFEGHLEEGRISGQFTQGSSLPLVFSRHATDSASTAVEPLTPALLATLRNRAGATGMAAAAVNRRGRSLNLADGLRAAGQPFPVTISDKWHIGSCTKSMTSTLVARAVMAGLVSWDDRVGQVLGAQISDMHAEYRDVTFRHLLSHRSGLNGNIPVGDLLRFPRETADSRADRVAYAGIALRSAPVGPKERNFTYSNNGYVIAGAMLEAKLGQPWEELIKKHLFQPLGMTGAGFGAPGTPGAFDQPVGHTSNPLGVLSSFPPGSPVTDNPAVLGPAGRVHAGLADILIYLMSHAERSNFLSADLWRVLHTPPYGGGYAMGWEIRDGALWHNGSNTLWYAEMIADPKRGLAAMAAVNDGRVALVGSPTGAALMSAAQAVA